MGGDGSRMSAGDEHWSREVGHEGKDEHGWMDADDYTVCMTGIGNG